MANTLGEVFGRHTTFSASSSVSMTTRRFAGFSQAVDEIVDARVYSGIHFRRADEQGAAIGKRVARYGARNYFQREHKRHRGRPM